MAFRRNDYVEIGRPSDVKNLFKSGTLIETVPKKESSSPYWKIKLDDGGGVEYCEEDFLQRIAKKAENK